MSPAIYSPLNSTWESGTTYKNYWALPCQTASRCLRINLDSVIWNLSSVSTVSPIAILAIYWEVYWPIILASSSWLVISTQNSKQEVVTSFLLTVLSLEFFCIWEGQDPNLNISPPTSDSFSTVSRKHRLPPFLWQNTSPLISCNFFTPDCGKLDSQDYQTWIEKPFLFCQNLCVTTTIMLWRKPQINKT